MELFCCYQFQLTYPAKTSDIPSSKYHVFFFLLFKDLSPLPKPHTAELCQLSVTVNSMYMQLPTISEGHFPYFQTHPQDTTLHHISTFKEQGKCLTEKL